MKIEIKQGKYGKEDRIILFTSTDKNNTLMEGEALTIFKLGLLVNQLAFNELNIKSGYKKSLMIRGEPLYFEEAIKEAIDMAKKNINWAEPENWHLVEEWAERWKLKVESIEPKLSRTFQPITLKDFE